MIMQDIESMTGISVPLIMLKVSESLFNLIVKATITTERRLRIVVKTARRAYHVGVIYNVGWIRSRHNLAFGLTKVGRCKQLG